MAHAKLGFPRRVPNLIIWRGWSVLFWVNSLEPVDGFFQPLPQSDFGLPIEVFFRQRNIGLPAGRVILG